jgi:hypothetical protein
MKVGRRLAMKLLNAARFALMQAEPRGAITEPLDRGMLTALADLVQACTSDLEAYEYSGALQKTEKFFWEFCDDYLELVKGRRYGVESDPDAAKSVYVTDVDFPKPGYYEMLALVRLDERLVAATPSGPPVHVSRRSAVPDVGDRAPRVHTPTKSEVHGQLAKIDTRVPPDSMHDADLADVLGKRPVVLLFATPALCQSRVCGPVVDIAEQVKAERGGDAAFIHMEIYRNNQVDQGYRPQVLAWHLRTEPWLFTIDRHGRIAARIEGAFGVRELNEAIDKAVKR